MKVILKKTEVGPHHQVVTLESDDCRYRKEPCPQCPWSQESPVGAFPKEAYQHSARTAYDMSTAVFSCHMEGSKKPTICAGFLLKGSVHNLAIRLALIKRKINLNLVSSTVPLYSNYREMAEANGVAPQDQALEKCR